MPGTHRYLSERYRGGLLAGALICAGCAPTSDRQIEAAAAKLSLCEKVEALIHGHANGFEQLRGSYRSTPYTDIWNARYDVIGKGCEIWRTGTGSTHYVCTLTAPDLATADNYYRESREQLRGCLGPDWTEQETPRKLGVGVKTVFSKPGEKATLAVHKIQTGGVVKDQWTLYYFVGEPNDQL